MSDEPSLGHAHLEVTKGADPGLVLVLRERNVTLGRVPGNTHVIRDGSISRQHVKVFLRDGRHWLADMNSTHGTFVNGARVTLHTLADGDEIRIGTTVLRYRAPRTDAAPAAARTAPPPADPRSEGAAGASTGSFELEMPESDAPPRAPPPPSMATRAALTPQGEDPFADEAADGARPGAGGGDARIELRGETARQFVSRAGGSPVAAAPRAATAHVPPPIAKPPRTRGPFAFLRDELDQRGPSARFAATLLALAAAALLFWLSLRLLEAMPEGEDPAAVDTSIEQGPPRPVLPERR